MDFGKLAEHIANFFTQLYKLLEDIKTWASESADKLKK